MAQSSTLGPLLSGRGPGPAGTLLFEDALQKMIHRDGTRSLRTDKLRGLIPKGQHSVFGDFPAEHWAHPRSPAGGDAASQMPRRPMTSPAAGARSGAGASRPSTPGGVRRPGTAERGGFDFGRRARTPDPSGPRRAGSTRRRPIASSELRRFYDRGDLPVQIHHGNVGGGISWKVDVEKLDFHHYLPIFFDGLREKEDPYRFLAVQGSYDMLELGGSKILPVVPQLIIPIKTALNTRDPEIIATMLKVLQALVLCGEMIGEALVPYYRQILPVFNIFHRKNLNIGDSIDYAQRKRMNIGDLIAETLEIFEVHGGDDAFINIKYMIPTYESAVVG